MSGPEAMERILKGTAVVPGRARGTALVSSQPLSLWGGLNPETGEIIDRRHDRSGAIVTGKVFVFPTGKGSSTTSTIFSDSEQTTYLQKAGNPTDLQLTKLVTPTSAVAGSGRFTYTLVITNDGPATANAVQVVDAFPRQLDFVSATASDGSNMSFSLVPPTDIKNPFLTRSSPSGGTLSTYLRAQIH